MARENTLLGNLVLSPHLALRQIIETGRVTWEDKRTLGGMLISRHAIGQGGRKWQLDGVGGHFTVGQIQAIRQLMDAAQPVRLEHHIYSGMVRIDSIASFSMIIDYADPQDDDWVSATLDLTEIA